MERIEGRNLGHVSKLYVDQLNNLLYHTITRTPLSVAVRRYQAVAEIRFRQSGTSAPARIRTHFGPMELSINVLCDAVEGERNRVHLRVISYRYTIAPLDALDPIIRWEYERFPSAGSYWCQHHLQGPIDLNVGRGRTVSLNDVHLPTGPVPIEESIRFLIVDLGVPPLDTSVDDDGIPGWHRRLSDSAADLSGE